MSQVTQRQKGMLPHHCSVLWYFLKVKKWNVFPNLAVKTNILYSQCQTYFHLQNCRQIPAHSWNCTITSATLFSKCFSDQFMILFVVIGDKSRCWSWTTMQLQVCRSDYWSTLPSPITTVGPLLPRYVSVPFLWPGSGTLRVQKPFTIIMDFLKPGDHRTDPLNRCRSVQEPWRVSWPRGDQVGSLLQRRLIFTADGWKQPNRRDGWPGSN